MHVTSARRQENAVNAIKDYGGWVRYDFQYTSGKFSHKQFDSTAKSWAPDWALEQLGFDFFHDVVYANLVYSEDSGNREENENFADDALQHLPGLPNLRFVGVVGTQATDSNMRHLARLTKLESLIMWDASMVGDNGVRHLVGLKTLRDIHINNSQITDDSMVVFAGLPKLEQLSLQGNRFSNDALMHIGGLNKLKSLYVGLGENAIDDAGLVHLKGLTRLESLGLQRCNITGSGFVHLENLANLKELWVNRRHIADSELDPLLKKLPNLSVH